LSAGGIGDAVQPLFGDLAKPYDSANLFLAIDIAGFRPVADFTRDASAFADKIRTSRRAPGTTEIRMPGDRAARAHRDPGGTVTIAGSTVAALRKSAAKLNVAIPAPFNA
jgi:LDH2 family malate/lactate/ureidoglycolate dehydrogenase